MTAQTIKHAHSGSVNLKVTLAWADEPFATEEPIASDEWAANDGEVAAYGLSAMIHAPNRAVSSEDEEETAAASAAGVPDRVASSEDEEEATAAPAA